MKYFKILPAAASIIALTATIAFARDMKETEETDAYRIRIEVRESANSAEDAHIQALPGAADSENKHIYLVEIERGNKTRVVSIDAYSGKILGNSEIATRKS